MAAALQERPDAILPTMGGQTALNLAKNLSEVSMFIYIA
jgi:carbamoylphosphate synthase large subunit